MPCFEITGAGFDASTDQTDARVLWVWAPSATYLADVIEGCPFSSRCELTGIAGDEIGTCLDYTLPADEARLRERLASYGATK